MLPVDLLFKVFQSLLIPDLLECSGVSRCWKDVVEREIVRRTRHKSLLSLINKQKKQRKSDFVKLIIKGKLGLSLNSFFNQSKFSAVLKNINGCEFSHDFDLYPSLIASIRWLNIPENTTMSELKDFKWQITTPILSSEFRKGYKPRNLTVLRGKEITLLSGSLEKSKPVIKDNIISLYSFNSTVVALWNDTHTVAFVVHSIPLSIKFLSTNLFIKIPQKTVTLSMELQEFSITALLTLRNFKKVFVHEMFNKLFFEADGVLQGFDEHAIHNIRLHKDCAMLWKTDNFKGKIPDCLIVDLTLKHNRGFKHDNPWDMTNYSLSKLCVLEPIPSNSYNDSFSFGSDDSFHLKAENELLFLEIILGFCHDKDCYTVQHINVKCKY